MFALPHFGRWWFLVGAVFVAWILVLWLHRHHVRASMREVVTLTRGHLTIFAALIGFTVALSIIVGALARDSLRTEREQRVQADIASLQDRTLTRQQVAGIAQAMIKLTSPSDTERNRRNLEALQACVKSGECRRLLTTIVVRTLQPKTTKGAAKTIVVKGQPGPRGPQGLPGPAGQNGTNGQDGQAGKQGGTGTVDSNILDGVDNRVADLEKALQDVVSHVAILDRLVAVLCRVLTPTRCA